MDSSSHHTSTSRGTGRVSSSASLSESSDNHKKCAAIEVSESSDNEKCAAIEAMNLQFSNNTTGGSSPSRALRSSGNTMLMRPPSNDFTTLPISPYGKERKWESSQTTTASPTENHFEEEGCVSGYAAMQPSNYATLPSTSSERKSKSLQCTTAALADNQGKKESGVSGLQTESLASISPQQVEKKPGAHGVAGSLEEESIRWGVGIVPASPRIGKRDMRPDEHLVEAHLVVEDGNAPLYPPGQGQHQLLTADVIHAQRMPQKKNLPTDDNEVNSGFSGRRLIYVLLAVSTLVALAVAFLGLAIGLALLTEGSTVNTNDDRSSYNDDGDSNGISDVAQSAGEPGNASNTDDSVVMPRFLSFHGIDWGVSSSCQHVKPANLDLTCAGTGEINTVDVKGAACQKLQDASSLMCEQLEDNAYAVISCQGESDDDLHMEVFQNTSSTSGCEELLVEKSSHGGQTDIGGGVDRVYGGAASSYFSFGRFCGHRRLERTVLDDGVQCLHGHTASIFNDGNNLTVVPNEVLSGKNWQPFCYDFGSCTIAQECRYDGGSSDLDCGDNITLSCDVSISGVAMLSKNASERCIYESSSAPAIEDMLKVINEKYANNDVLVDYLWKQWTSLLG